MKYLKNKEEYEKAKDELRIKTAEVQKLKMAIKNFENENLIPEFDTLDDLRHFLAEEPEEGKVFKYQGDKYKVDDIEEFIKEYGYDTWSDGVWHSSFVDLLWGGRLSIIRKI